MHDILFITFAVLIVAFGALVVSSKNPVNSAMFLVPLMICVGGLFVLLEAYFLAAIQILVYAGAVMVVFLFIIMLLDLKAEEKRSVSLFAAVTGIGSSGAILGVLCVALTQSDLGVAGQEKAALADASARQAGETIPLGKLLFTDYVLPFEILSILLLVAMVGVILLSKKKLQ
ncbi:MAG: NADH-quinone oxidoreductase subunit J [Candidatus Binatia bacterium]|jgi:NADH-quinone oxidoreductase subunit J